MSYRVIHKDQTHSENYPINQLLCLLAESENDSEEYVALTHESNWSLSVSPSNILVWENNLSDLSETWHMKDVPNSKILQLWTLLASGEIEEIKREEWLLGDPIFGLQQSYLR